jgi:hypothetical protein
MKQARRVVEAAQAAVNQDLRAEATVAQSNPTISGNNAGFVAFILLAIRK